MPSSLPGQHGITHDVAYEGISLFDLTLTLFTQIHSLLTTTAFSAFLPSHSNMGSIATALGLLGILPSELRNRIYAFLLDARYCEISGEGRLKFHSEILAANRTINGEASPSFHRRNKFIKFKFPKNGDDGEVFKETFPLINLRTSGTLLIPPSTRHEHHNSLFLYTMPKPQAKTARMRHHIMSLELRRKDLPLQLTRSRISMNMTEDEVISHECAQYIQIVLPLSQLHHITHHLSSLALSKALCTTCTLHLEIGNSYNDYIPLDQVLAPARVMHGEMDVQITTSASMEENVRQHAWSKPLDFATVLKGWLDRNEGLIDIADVLWSKKLYDDAAEVVWYTWMVLTTVMDWFVLLAPPQPPWQPQRTSDLFGDVIAEQPGPLRQLRVRHKELKNRCRQIMDDWEKVQADYEAEEGEVLPT